MNITQLVRQSERINTIFDTCEVEQETGKLAELLGQTLDQCCSPRVRGYEMRYACHCHENRGMPLIRRCYYLSGRQDRCIEICFELREHRLHAYVGVRRLSHDCGPQYWSRHPGTFTTCGDRIASNSIESLVALAAQKAADLHLWLIDPRAMTGTVAASIQERH